MAERPRLLVALVLLGPERFEVDGLRRGLGSDALSRIPPHITLVAPLNVALDAQPAINSHLRGVAARFGPLSLDLGPVETFAPQARVVYLRVHEDLKELHRALNSGPLSAPPAREERDFVAHVTLTTKASDARIDGALTSLSSFRLSVEIDRLTLFEQEQHVAGQIWSPVAEFLLGPGNVVGRGGRELTFVHSTRLDSQASAFLERHWNDHLAVTRPDQPGDHDLVVLVETRDELVGLCRARVVGEVLVIDQLVVAAQERSSGIGTQLLVYLERLARDEQCRRLHVVAHIGIETTFFVEHGYVVRAGLDRPGVDRLGVDRLGSLATVLLERSL